MPFQTVNPRLLFRKNDPSDLRWGETVQPKSADQIQSPCTVLLGYPDDEGIANNGGRIGARNGPDQIRRFFYRMTTGSNRSPVADIGNLETQKSNLEERHAEARKTVQTMLQKDIKVVSLGGGHDYGYPDTAAFVETYKSKKPLVINFDAHYDVRDLSKGLTSGTPFFRLLENHSGFDFVSIGTQAQCNSKAHQTWLKNKKATLLEREDSLNSGQPFHTWALKELNSLLSTRRPCFISLDIDVFSSAHAPGCSQSWPTGITPDEFFPLFQTLLTKLDVRGLGIYEVSPDLDVQDMTSKLASVVIHQFVSHAGSL